MKRDRKTRAALENGEQLLTVQTREEKNNISFSQKEKRKREPGRASRGKGYVEKEKRMLRECKPMQSAVLTKHSHECKSMQQTKYNYRFTFHYSVFETSSDYKTLRIVFRESMNSSIMAGIVNDVEKLRTTRLAEAETTRCLVFRYHATSLACINGFQQFYNLIHVRSPFWVCIPTSSHDICQRTRTASRDFWS